MLTMSVKGKYGVAAAVELALHYEKGPLQIKQIALAQQIPQNYLELILVELKRNGLVTSFRGSRGGYALAKKPNDITLTAILSCLEGPLQLSTDKTSSAVLQELWETVEESIQETQSITLGTLLLNKQRLESVTNYSI